MLECHDQRGDEVRTIRRAVITRIAVNNRVSLAVAKHIYECRSIKWKQRACEEELKRQENLPVSSGIRESKS